MEEVVLKEMVLVNDAQPPILKFTRAVTRHWEGAVRRRIRTGLLEWMNRLVQAAKAGLRGYRNGRKYITLICLIEVNEDFTYLTPSPLATPKSKDAAGTAPIDI